MDKMIDNKDVIVVNKEKLEKIKGIMRREGKDKLHVLSDFDRTLTYAFTNGKKIPSLISVLRDEDYLTEEYRKEAHALFNKYHPIEIDPSVPLKEKKKAMHEWWVSHFNLLIKSRLNIKDIEKAVQSNRVRLRQGAKELLSTLHKNNVPLVIISSSGVGVDGIKLFLQKNDALYNNAYIVSNRLIWDNQGYMIGYKEPVIHSKSKDETTLNEFDFYPKIKDRKNVVLLGDSLEDVDMITGFDYDYLIKIGFLNYHVEQGLPIFKKNYDVILLNDQSMDYVNKLVKDIVE